MGILPASAVWFDRCRSQYRVHGKYTHWYVVQWSEFSLPTMEIWSVHEDVENNIRGCENELDMIDRSLRLKKMTDGER